ncbi:hypothetical protein NDU88_009344 [Pleurodeles waltl]|uniref:Uncharacterized protein n=1 Tax=Pleurodeles waltl TaxID=8319 RepID=A0AAV7RY84_PLEWA|nr:hypothetical protein NDU88_009344 [Pleurodeles waltl]
MPLWRLRAKALTDPLFMATVNKTLTCYFNENRGSASNRARDWEAMKIVLRGIYIKMTYRGRQQLERDITAHEQHLGALETLLPTHPDRLTEWQKAFTTLLDKFA